MQLVWGPEFRIALIGVLCVWVEDSCRPSLPLPGASREGA